MSVDVGIGILDFAEFVEDTGSERVDLRNKFEEFIIREMFQCEFTKTLIPSLLGQVPLRHVTRIRLSEDGMAVTGNDTTALQGGPDVFLDGVIRDICADGILHLHDPSKDFLVGETVKRTGETVQSSSEGQHGTRQGGTNEMGRVSRDITTLMIGMDSQIQSHQFNELIILTESHQMSEIVSVILVFFDGGEFTVLVHVAVNSGCDGGKLGDQGHGILESVFPVFLLVETLGISLGKGRLLFQCRDGWKLAGKRSWHTERELRHGVEIAGTSVDEFFNEFRDV